MPRKFYRPFFFILTLGCGFLSLTSAQEETNMEGLSETIHGEVKERLDIQKPPPTIDLNSQEIVESGTPTTEKVLQEAKPIPSEEDFDHYKQLDSNQILRPWNPLIPEPPLVSFYPGFAKSAVHNWEFRVFDERGEIVKNIKGKGLPPKKIEWDGIKENGKYISVGTLYSYDFITYDDHRNSRTYPGEPFQLDVMMYTLKGKTIIEFSNKALFPDGFSFIRPEMQGMWSRALDVIRQNSNKPITIEIQAENRKSSLPEERRQNVVNSISDSLNIPTVDIRYKVDQILDRGDVLRVVMNNK